MPTVSALSLVTPSHRWRFWVLKRLPKNWGEGNKHFSKWADWLCPIGKTLWQWFGNCENKYLIQVLYQLQADCGWLQGRACVRSGRWAQGLCWAPGNRMPRIPCWQGLNMSPDTISSGPLPPSFLWSYHFPFLPSLSMEQKVTVNFAGALAERTHSFY